MISLPATTTTILIRHHNNHNTICTYHIYNKCNTTTVQSCNAWTNVFGHLVERNFIHSETILDRKRFPVETANWSAKACSAHMDFPENVWKELDWLFDNYVELMLFCQRKKNDCVYCRWHAAISDGEDFRSAVECTVCIKLTRRIVWFYLQVQNAD